MTPLFTQYPKCTTCKRAKAWLEGEGISFTDRHIVEEQPTLDELKAWWAASGLPLKRFFNTCGVKYREMKLSTELAKMSEEEQLALLATDGMLVKRPILVTEKGAFPGFKEANWKELL